MRESAVTSLNQDGMQISPSCAAVWMAPSEERWSEGCWNLPQRNGKVDIFESGYVAALSQERRKLHNANIILAWLSFASVFLMAIGFA